MGSNIFHREFRKNAYKALYRNKIMKALERQNQYQPQKTMQIWNKLKRTDEQLARTANTVKGMQRMPLKGLLNFQHRRKYQLPQYNETTASTLPRKSEQFESVSKLEQRERKMGENIRHTHHATDLKDFFRERASKMETPMIRDFTRERVKCSMGQQYCYFQQPNKTKTGWKLKEKVGKTKEKTEKSQSQEHHSKTFKKLEQLNQTLYFFGTKVDEGSFLSLINKFKFQNLRTVSEIDKCLYSVATNRKQGQKRRQAEFTPFGKTPQKVQKMRQTEKIHILTNCETKPSKVKRKISSLSPWEMRDDTEFITSLDMQEV